MRKISWEEVDKIWSGLQKRHRMEIAEAVASFCIGRKADEVGKRLGYSRQWVMDQLEFAGIGQALGQGVNAVTPQLAGRGGGNNNVNRDKDRLIKDFAPNVEVKLRGKGGSQSVASIEGEDADAFEPYLQHYLQEGHEPAAATRLAKAEWAGETAVEAGVIQESTNKKNERVNRILFPEKEKDDFELNLASHMNKVRQAAKFLDNAKVNLLRRKSTCEKVAQANAEWTDQVDRIRNFHSTFNKVS